MSLITETGAAVTKSALVCPWCTKEFKPRRGGSAQRFCNARCRTACWSALRRWSEAALSAGTLSIDVVRSGRLEACTPREITEVPHAHPETGSVNQPSPAPLKQFRVQISKAVITALVFRHHQIRFSQQDDLIAIITALARLGHKPKISETPEHVRVFSF